MSNIRTEFMPFSVQLVTPCAQTMKTSLSRARVPRQVVIIKQIPNLRPLFVWTVLTSCVLAADGVWLRTLGV